MREPTETTREQAAEWLGVSINTIQRLEKDGKIRVRREGKYVYLLADDVRRARMEWRPQRARRVRVSKPEVVHIVRGGAAKLCYPLFDEGLPINEVVVRTGVDPLLVRQLYDEWGMSFEDGKKKREEESERKRQERLQRQHESRMRLEKWQRWKLELARIEARGERREDAGPEPPRGDKR